LGHDDLHKYPHVGVPGPAIGFLQERVRWWDRWLKGVDNGVMEEPMLRVWMQDSVPPSASYDDRPGRWVAEPSWPSPHIRPMSYSLTRTELLPHDGTAAGGLAEGAAGDGVALPIQSPLSVGMFAGKWASYSAVPDLPYDQREEDGGALVFETAALEHDLEIFGLPTATLEVESDKPVAMLAVRLSDVAPNGEATRVTYGLLNLTHRDGSADPQPLEPGKRYTVEVPLNGIAQVFPAGHRLRLSISTSYWPLAWPSPERATVTVHTAGSRLTVPSRPRRPRGGRHAAGVRRGGGGPGPGGHPARHRRAPLALIMSLRYGLHDGRAHSLEEIAERVGLTRERIRQLEKQSLSQLRDPGRSHPLLAWAG
jgi:putative CocE/NonD family hydrolase